MSNLLLSHVGRWRRKAGLMCVGPTTTLLLDDESLSLGAHWLHWAETGKLAGKENVINICIFGNAAVGRLVEMAACDGLTRDRA